MHQAMISQSNFLMDSVHNAIRRMTTNDFMGGYKGSCYSQPKSSAAAASREAAPAVVNIGSLPMPANPM